MSETSTEKAKHLTFLKAIYFIQSPCIGYNMFPKGTCEDSSC